MVWCRLDSNEHPSQANYVMALQINSLKIFVQYLFNMGDKKCLLLKYLCSKYDPWMYTISKVGSFLEDTHLCVYVLC
jgi:hypothetical protein